jgi:protein subunit release factor A
VPRPLHPPPYAVDERALARDTRVEIFTGGGPGGQHRNKTQNAVRLVHPSSGVTVVASERRSLEANRRAAFERLLARLVRLNTPRRTRKPTRPSRGSVERRLGDKARTARKKSTRGRRPGAED